jgi:hypothetical protein
MAKWSEKPVEANAMVEGHRGTAAVWVAPSEDNFLGVAPLRVEGEPMSFDTCPDCAEGTCGCAAPDNSWLDDEDDKETYCAAVKDGYFPLFDVLRDALDQAQSGKGEERHGNGLPFTEQPALTITRTVGLGFPLGQAMKKIQESQRMDLDAAKLELLGAINYLAAAILFLQE